MEGSYSLAQSYWRSVEIGLRRPPCFDIDELLPDNEKVVIELRRQGQVPIPRLGSAGEWRVWDRNPCRIACPTFRGQRNKDQTTGPAVKRNVKSVYHFFKRRRSCPCDECQGDLFDSGAIFARLSKGKGVIVCRRYHRQRFHLIPSGEWLMTRLVTVAQNCPSRYAIPSNRSELPA